MAQGLPQPRIAHGYLACPFHGQQAPMLLMLRAGYFRCQECKAEFNQRREGMTFLVSAPETVAPS